MHACSPIWKPLESADGNACRGCRDPDRSEKDKIGWTKSDDD
jgi:hypothetical protein